MTLSPRVESLRPTAVNSILQEVRALQQEGRDLISLMRGEPDFRTPPQIVEAAARALRDGRTAYPDNRGEPALREAIATKMERDNGLRYDPASEILVTTGATFGFYAAIAALVGEGDGVLLPDPVYDAYASPIRLAGGCIQPVRAVLDNGRLRIPAAALEAACTESTRVLVLNTPWNPVGTVLRESELREIAAFAGRRGLTIISDEIYEAITYDGAAHLSIAAAEPELRDRCVIVNSLSKTYAMTGWRAGYCAGPAPLIAAMFLVLQQSSRGPATFVQDAAAAALNGSQQCVLDMRAEYAARRALVLARLGGLPRARPLPPEGGFFAMIDARDTGLPSNEIRRRLLTESGVVVVHGAAYGAGAEGTLRVSFAAGGSNLERGLALLHAGLESL